MAGISIHSYLLVLLPVVAPVVLQNYFAHRKTRDRNTQEHLQNKAALERAERYSKVAAVRASQAKDQAESAALGVARLEGRVETYISEHDKVHAQLDAR